MIFFEHWYHLVIFILFVSIKRILLTKDPSSNESLGLGQDGDKGSNKVPLIDAIIALWEGIEYVEETKPDYWFLKINFDKAYDRIEWEFVPQSMHDLGLGKRFIHFVHLLFGNASARVSVNGVLSDSFLLRRSIRQGCPLSPLLYVITSDALGWLIKDCIRGSFCQASPSLEQMKKCAFNSWLMIPTLWFIMIRCLLIPFGTA